MSLIIHCKNRYFFVSWLSFLVSLICFSVLSYLLLLCENSLLIIIELILVFLVVLFFIRKIKEYQETKFKYFEVACYIIIIASLERFIFYVAYFFRLSF